MTPTWAVADSPVSQFEWSDLVFGASVRDDCENP
jgi:hypothetical protein